jgi:hypothetical protein
VGRWRGCPYSPVLCAGEWNDTDTETLNPFSADTYEDKNELDDQDDEDDEEDDEVFDKNNVDFHIEILRLRENLVNAKENEIRAYKAQLPYTEHLTGWCRFRDAQSNPAYVKYANDFHFSMPPHMPTLKALRFAVELAGMESSMAGLNLKVADAALRRKKVRHYLAPLSDETEESLTKDFESLKLEVDGVQRQMVALRASYAAKEDSGATFTLVPGTPSPSPFS